MLSTVPFFSIFALLGFAASLMPLYWQFEAWNVGAIWYIFWIALSCFTQYFNAILWAGNTTTSAHMLCEISIRIAMAASVGLPAASMVINRRLYIFACMPPSVEATKSIKHRAIVVDSFICGLFPTLYIALQAASQRHRFTILEDVGCFPDLSDTLPTYFISFTAPLLLSFGSAVYCALSVIEMSASRGNFAEALSGHRNLTPSRFLRLHGLALATLFLTIPLDLLNVAANATLTALVTRVSGDAAPFSFNVVARIPRALWTASESAHAAVELGRWIAPVCAILFFAFFGLAAEARTHYTRGFTVVSNALWNTLARMGWVRPLPPLPGTAHAPRPLLLRVVPARPRPTLISHPIRGVSGTGSFSDVSTPLALPFSRFSRCSTLHMDVFATSAPSSISEALSTATPVESGKTSPALSSSSNPTTTNTMPTTYASPSPSSAYSQRSYVAVTPSPTEPDKYILPLYQGWYHISNPEVGHAMDVDRATEMEMVRGREMPFIDEAELKPLPEIPRGRTLV